MSRSADAVSAVETLLSTVLDLPPHRIPPERNLIELGIDSIAMMRIAGSLRKQGIGIGFADLTAAPTLAAWRELATRAAGSPTADPVAMGEFDDLDPFAMAPMQRAYWVGRGDGQRLGGVAAHFYNEFDGGDLDPDRLEAAVRRLFARHAMLRAKVVNDDRMQVLPVTTWQGLRVHDLRALSPDAAAAALDEMRGRLAHRHLDVTAGEMFDVQLSLLPDAMRRHGTRLHVNLDMMAADALSLRILLLDLARFYVCPSVEPVPIAYSYPRYLAARDARHGQELHAFQVEADRRYWRARLPTMPSAPQLPTTVTDTREGAMRVVRRHRWLSPDRFGMFCAEAHRHGLTPAMALAAIFAETLAGWSAEPRFILNLPVFDREPLHPDAALLVGDFTSSLILAWEGEEQGDFATRARAFQHRFHADMGHATHSGLAVLREMSGLRGEQTLAPVVYTSAIGLGDLFPAEVRDAFGQAVWIVSQGPQVWLDAQVTELDGGVLVNIDAREDAFADGVLDGMFTAYSMLLDRLIERPLAWTSPVAALLPPAQAAVRARVNATGAALPDRRLHDGFFAHALRTPDAPALLWGVDGRMTYAALRSAALRVAGALVGQGVVPGDVVAVQLPKGPEQVVAVLGVLAAGAAYLPIGIDQPDMRRQRICDAAGIAVLLRALPVGAEPIAAPVAGRADDLAYILYTSGSTGEPKGVEIPHAAAMNTILDLGRRLSLDGRDRVLALSALEFDLSVYDIFAPLGVGGAVVCLAEDHRRDAGAWRAAIRRHEVTVLNCVPALLDMVLTAADADAADTRLRAVLLGGDRVTLDLPSRLRAWAPQCRFIALGGTTETAIHSTFREVNDIPPHWRCVPYGVPLANVRLRVVDVLDRDCPDMVEGELWIGGAGVARGYRGDPERTAVRFVEHDGIRWYRTGDRARYWPDGEVEFLGRADFQVKLRGHRVELGEVEAAMAAWPGTAQAVAIVGPEGMGMFAVAAVSARTSGWIDLREPDDRARPLRDFLRMRLPPSMMPDRLRWLDALPLTPNGKVDRPALARDLTTHHPEEGTTVADAPKTEVERRVAEIWSQILGIEAIGRDRNFFSLGGDSLSATRIMPLLRAAGLVGATLADMFAHPRLMDFASRLQLSDAGETPRTLSTDPAGRHAPFAPTEVQRAYWLGRDPAFVLGGTGCHFYREYDIADLDLPRLETALNTLVARHGMLRAVFDQEGRQQVMASVPEYRIDVIEADGDGETRRAALRETCAHRVFDPARWPLFHIAGVREQESTRLAIGLDNLVLDALSILRFYTELDQLYADPGCAAPPPGLSFRDYLANAVPPPDVSAAARQYWDDCLPTLPPAPRLPLARDPAQLGVPRFVRLNGGLDTNGWRHLREQAAAHGITASAVLLAAFAETLGRWSSQPELTLNLTLFDRQSIHPDIDRIMGDFTSLTLLGYRPQSDDDWLARALSVQRELGQALEHRAISSVTLVRDLARIQACPDLAMPVVFTSALGVPGGTAATEQGPFSRQVWGLTQTPQVWLDHQVVETAGGIAINWDYVDRLFPPGMIDAMFGAYLRLLDWLGTSDWRDPMPDLLPDDQAAARRRVNHTAARTAAVGLHDGFFREAANRPGRIALIDDDGTVDYGTLAGLALRTAAGLRHAGVVPGDLVAVSLAKGVPQVAAVLGVLAAGAAYLPIGVDQPPARRERILRTANVRCVIGQGGLAWDALQPHAPLAAPHRPEGHEAAYVIFTSGSTGEPKGVEISHAAASNTLQDVIHRFGIGVSDRALAVSALDFDLSVFDLFGMLSTGASLVLVAEDDRQDAYRWREKVRRHGVTVWNSVPALLDMLLTASDTFDDLSTLRVALLSGDWIGLDLPGRLRRQAARCHFIALGGATEASIWSNFHEVGTIDPDWRSIPYGVPLANQCFRVVDAHGRDCPDWVPGELWIGGDGVASGYRHAPQLTARRFVVHDGVRWYRTGDLGRYRPDGLLEFLGRQDRQVKLRGHRIELGEIESALLKLPIVTQVCAAIVNRSSAPRLAAAVVAGDAFDAASARAALSTVLPSHMIPERIVPMWALPLTANGKLDTAAITALLETAGNDDGRSGGGFRNAAEHRVATWWGSLLGTSVANREADFFALGGDSLLATRFIATVRAEDGVNLPLRRLFAAPTLRDVATAIEDLKAAAAGLEEGAL